MVGYGKRCVATHSSFIAQYPATTIGNKQNSISINDKPLNPALIETPITNGSLTPTFESDYHQQLLADEFTILNNITSTKKLTIIFNDNSYAVEQEAKSNRYFPTSSYTINSRIEIIEPQLIVLYNFIDGKQGINLDDVVIGFFGKFNKKLPINLLRNRLRLILVPGNKVPHQP